MEFTRLSPALGAECLDCLEFPLSSESITTIKQALARHGVLVFRGQRGFSDQNQVELAGLFGPLLHDRNSQYSVVDGPVCTVEHASSDHDSGLGNAGEWHCDGVLTGSPFSAICLRLIEQPPCGGDTLFCSFDSVFESFTENYRNFLRGLTVRYSALRPVGVRRYLPTQRGAPVDLPLVVRRGDKESLFFSPKMACDLPQLSEREAMATLAFLKQSIELFQHQLRVSWLPDSVVLFDNTAVCHAVALDYFPATRQITRVVALGTKLQAAGIPLVGCPVLTLPTKKAE